MEQENFKEKLIDHINSSNLDADQKELWSLFVKLSYPNEDEAIYEAVTEDADSLDLLTKYLRDKIMTMKDANNDAWRTLVTNESRYAELLS